MNNPTWSSPNNPTTVPEDTTNTPTTNTSTPKILLTVEEAAAYLGIGRTTMFTLIRTGEVKSVLIGRLRRIRVTDLERYICNLTVAEAA